MATQSHPIFTTTLVASGAIVAHRFVKGDGAQAGENDAALGVARTAAADGDGVAVDTLGTAIVEAANVVAVDDRVACDGTGRVVPVDGGTYTQAVGVALEAAAQAGDLIEVHLIPN